MKRPFFGLDSLLAHLGFKRKKSIEPVRRNAFTRSLSIEHIEDRRVLATVTSSLDINDDNDGFTTLREAIEATLPGGIVDFVQSLNGAIINLNPTLGEIAFSKNLTIDAGGGLDGEVGDGDGFRIFNIFRTSPYSTPPLPMTTIKGLTLAVPNVATHTVAA